MKKVAMLLAVTTIAIGLVGCDKEPKKSYLHAYEEFHDAKTYELDKKITSKFYKGFIVGVEEKNETKYKDIGNSVEKKHELVELNEYREFPVYTENGKSYIHIEDYIEAAGHSGSGFVIGDQKYFALLDVVERNYEIDFETKYNIEHRYKEQQMFEHDLISAIKELPNKVFERKGDKFTVTVPKEEANLILEKAKEKTIDKKIEQKNKSKENGFEGDSADDYTVEDIKITSTIKKEILKKDVLKTTYNLKMGKRVVKVDVTVENVYKKINKPVKFSFDLKNEGVSTMKELNKKVEIEKQKQKQEGHVEELDFEPYPEGTFIPE